jgi:hypothetical protein
MKVCVALALLGTLCLTGVAANAQYYYHGPAIALGIGQAPYGYPPPVYFQARLLCNHWSTVNFNFTAGITSMHTHLIMAAVMGVE